MRKRIVLFSNYFLCALLVAAVFAAAFPAPAAAAVEMKVRPGLGGLYRTEQPLELLITLQNSGPEFEGAILVRQDEEQPERQRPGLAQFILNVRVPAGASEQFRMVIPGELASMKPVVELVSGGLVLAQSRVEGVAADGVRVVLALSGEIMERAWQSKSPGAEVHLKYLSPGELPEESLLLAAADAILVDPSSAPLLNGRQVRALKEWVHLGGTLSLMGGAGAGADGVFSDVSPVRTAGRRTVDGKLAGLRSGGPLDVASGELVAGRAIALENGVPVLARRELGRGQVLYCGALPGDLGDEARGVWSALFGASAEPDNKSLRYSPVGSVGTLLYASSYIPRLSGPPVPVLVLLWLVYVAAVGPLLYFILRRADRRDWAWVLVPAGALVAASSFYLLSPANRLQNYLAQTLATIEIFSPELAEVRAGATVVAARGGGLAVRAADNMYCVPSGNNDSPDGRPALVQQGEGKAVVNFGGVQYGSLRQVYAYGLRQGMGSIEGRLYLDGKSVKGDLVNRTGLDLRDSRLVLGGRVIQIGRFPAGGTVRIEETVEELNAPAGPEMLLAELGGRGRRPGDPFYRERQMLSENVYGESGRPAGIQFIGWHDGPPGVFEVAGKPGQREDCGLVLVKQAIKMDIAAGRFHLPAGFVSPRRGDLKYTAVTGAESKVIYDGHVDLVYNIDDAGIRSNFKIEALDIQYIQGQFTLPVEIYNHQQDKWEQLPDGGRRITADELSRYLNDNKVRLKVAGESPGPYPVWPGLAVEGVVS
ncbi:MAG TPA: hypothetical protein PK728_10295 [Bacillota bacterium]|nr:hypothetical protein [Bacillota bacterium]